MPCIAHYYTIANIYFIMYLVLLSRVSCGLYEPQTCYTAEGGFELLNFNPPPLKYWDYRFADTLLLSVFYFKGVLLLGWGCVWLSGRAIV